jgi:hypothetical protein
MQQLTVDIDKLRRLRQRFDFESGQALHSALFATDGLLTAIDVACGDADTPAAAGLRERLPTDVRAYLDEQIAEAGAPPMEWYRQGRFLRSVEEIVRSARIVAVIRTADGPLIADQQVKAACEVLGKHLVDVWDRLFAEAKSVDAPYDQPLLAMLERLNPLLTWVRERS